MDKNQDNNKPTGKVWGKCVHCTKRKKKCSQQWEPSDKWEPIDSRPRCDVCVKQGIPYCKNMLREADELQSTVTVTENGQRVLKPGTIQRSKKANGFDPSAKNPKKQQAGEKRRRAIYEEDEDDSEEDSSRSPPRHEFESARTCDTNKALPTVAHRSDPSAKNPKKQQTGEMLRTDSEEDSSRSPPGHELESERTCNMNQVLHQYNCQFASFIADLHEAHRKVVEILKLRSTNDDQTEDTINGKIEKLTQQKNDISKEWQIFRDKMKSEKRVPEEARHVAQREYISNNTTDVKSMNSLFQKEDEEHRANMVKINKEREVERKKYEAKIHEIDAEIQQKVAAKPPSDKESAQKMLIHISEEVFSEEFMARALEAIQPKRLAVGQQRKVPEEILHDREGSEPHDTLTARYIVQVATEEADERESSSESGAGPIETCSKDIHREMSHDPGFMTEKEVDIKHHLQNKALERQQNQGSKLLSGIGWIPQIGEWFGSKKAKWN